MIVLSNSNTDENDDTETNDDDETINNNKTSERRLSKLIGAQAAAVNQIVRIIKYM